MLMSIASSTPPNPREAIGLTSAEKSDILYLYRRPSSGTRRSGSRSLRPSGAYRDQAAGLVSGSFVPEQQSTPIETREVRIGRILSELHDRRARGEPIDQDKIAAENPDIADELRRHFATLKDLQRQDQTIEGLVRQGLLASSAESDYRAELGPYRIIEYLGRGGMGIVLKAYEPALRRFVALKLLRPEMTEDAVALARFQREAQAAAGLHHPNILTIHAVGEHNGVHFISMEHIDGPTLADMIREQGPVSADVVRNLTKQILDGLIAAHDAGLIHRDIKPANLLLDKPAGNHDEGGGLPKIADFGLARVLSSQTKLTLPEQSFGTPQYMSPEQARGDEDIDHRTDLYSAGVVLYEMLTGRVPFRSETPTGVVHQILSNDPPEPALQNKSCDPALASIAMRLLAKRREDRFASAAEVLAALRSGRRVTSYERSRRQRRFAGRAVLLIAAITGIGWLLSGMSNASAPITAAKGIDNLVVVQRGTSSEWQPLYRFAEPNRVMAAAAVAHGSTGKTIVVASAQFPTEPQKILLAFDEDGGAIWDMDLSSDMDWPDCDSSRGWNCIGLLAADLDGQPGDEIIAIASDIGDYPSRFSIIDPVTRTIRATLWHQGDPHWSSDDVHRTIWLERDFFGPGHHAIIAKGVNNKLDGFYEPRETDPPPLTKWDIVPDMMIIDPRMMLGEGEGVGPPISPRLPFAPSRAIHAYAFLDLSTTDDNTFVDGADEVRRTLAAPTKYDVGCIEQLARSSEKVTDGTGPWFIVDLKHSDRKWGTVVTVDRDLQIRRIQKMPHDPAPKPDSFWREKWKVIDLRG